jgi:hypothetical protein
MLCNDLHREYTFGMSQAFEDELARIRTTIPDASSFDDISALDKDVEIVVKALDMQAAIVEKHLHQLQGAITFRSMGVTSPEASALESVDQ